MVNKIEFVPVSPSAELQMSVLRLNVRHAGLPILRRGASRRGVLLRLMALLNARGRVGKSLCAGVKRAFRDREQILPLAIRSRPQGPQLRTADPGSEGTALPENTPALHGAETLDGTHRDAGKMVLPERVFGYAEKRQRKPHFGGSHVRSWFALCLWDGIDPSA